MKGLGTIEGAMHFAVSAHAGQVDKSGHPYILHIARVAGSLWRFDKETVIAALLHDVVEDTLYTLIDLQHMGASPRVVNAVDSVTKRLFEPYEAALRRAMDDPVGFWVKAADVLDNAARCGDLDDPVERARLQQKYRAAFGVLRERASWLRLGVQLRPDRLIPVAGWGV